MTQALLEKKILLCPVCRAPLSLSEDGRGLRCEGKRIHTFDLSKSGYVNLSLKYREGDTLDACRSRHAFFETDPYSILRQNLSAAISDLELPEGIILDAGCGEGYYTNGLAGAFTDRQVLGADLSKFALDIASKEAKKTAVANVSYAVCNLTELPLLDESCACLCNIFAPCCESEFARVLADGGYLVFVYAGPEHLWGLKQALYDEVYVNEKRQDEPKGLKEISHQRVRETITVRSPHIKELFAMTPYYFHTSPDRAEKLYLLDELDTVVDFEIKIFRKESSCRPSL